jgi:hypothetical protein
MFLYGIRGIGMHRIDFQLISEASKENHATRLISLYFTFTFFLHFLQVFDVRIKRKSVNSGLHFLGLGVSYGKQMSFEASLLDVCFDNLIPHLHSAIISFMEYSHSFCSCHTAQQMPIIL